MEITEYKPTIINYNNQQNKLFTHNELLTKLHKLSTWKQEAWQEFSSRISSPEFPCLFSKRAWRSKSLRIIFCDKNGDSDNAYQDFLNGMIEYTDMIHTTQLNQRVFSPLVAFFSPDLMPSMSSHELGWDILNWTHQNDLDEWPNNIPYDPESPDWTYCFNGVQFFINMSSNNHHELQNRNLGSRLNFIVNAREVFDLVANKDTKGGRQVREKIRKRVGIYNNGVMPTELGFYGEENNLEWQQYQLQENSLRRPNKCPFKSHKSK